MRAGLHPSAIVLHQIIEEKPKDIYCYGCCGVWMFSHGHFHNQNYIKDGYGSRGTGEVWLIVVKIALHWEAFGHILDIQRERLHCWILCAY